MRTALMGGQCGRGEDARHKGAGEQLRLQGLSERDPESVEVTNNELTHAIEGIIKFDHDLNSVLEAPVQVTDVVSRYVQVDLAAVVRARFPACVEH